MGISRPLTSVLVAAGLVAGGAATAGASAVPRAGHHLRATVGASKRKIQLGIDLDYYANPGVNVSATATSLIRYVRSLHANAISVSFPFYVKGERASTAYGTGATPTTAELATLAADAERAHMYVSFRPLLDQRDLSKSRIVFQPANAGAFFASLEKFLKPYAAMAQKQHVQEFIEGAELTALQAAKYSKYWTRLDAYLRKVYRGTLAYSNNFGTKPLRSLRDKNHVLQLLDDYHPVKATKTASVALLTRGWDSYLAKQPRGVTISETGIAAEDNAYTKPYAAGGRGPFNPAIQVRWFTAACNAVANERLGGIYFWSIAFGQALNVPPTAAHPTAFVDGPGAKEIAACYRKLG